MCSPLISIVIPTYKRPDSLKKAIDNVLKQKYTNWEIIVVDDNGLTSSPSIKSEQIVRKFDQNIIIKYIKHDINRGACAARNTGILAARGRYVAFLDDDDAWEHNKLELQVSKMLANDSAGFCFCDLNQINLVNGHKQLVKFGFNDSDLFIQLLKKGTGICTSSLMVKKNLLLEVGLFDVNLPSYQDFDLLLKLSKVSKHIYIDTPLLDWNVSPKGISMNYESKYQGQKLILDKYNSYYSEKSMSKYYAERHAELGNYAILSGKRWAASKAYIKSVCASPTVYKSYIKLIVIALGGQIIYKLVSEIKKMP